MARFSSETASFLLTGVVLPVTRSLQLTSGRLSEIPNWHSTLLVSPPCFDPNLDSYASGNFTISPLWLRRELVDPLTVTLTQQLVLLHFCVDSLDLI